MAASQKENSLTNPKRTIARREQEAGIGDAPAKKSAPAKGDMTQAAFSKYAPKDKAKDKAGLEKALKKRG